MILCTEPGCREQARGEIKWSDQVSAGWRIASERAYCNAHMDQAIAELKRRGLLVAVTSFGMPVI